jgi:hypothetical protein
MMPSVTLNPPIVDPSELRQSIFRHMTHSLGLDPKELTPRGAFRSVELAVRDLMVERLFAT